MGTAKLSVADPTLMQQAKSGSVKPTSTPVARSTNPYNGNLQTTYNPYQAVDESDADVKEVQRRTNENADALAGRDKGVSFAANKASIAAAMARINLKNQLGQSISSNGSMENNAEGDLRTSAQNSADQGVKKTRENYNSRGLLYSGAREGGESQVRSAAAAGLSRDIASTKSDFQNSLDSQKQAYANVGLAQQAQQLDLANQAFDTATRNSVARAQAYQQLSSGLGQAAGYAYGSTNNKTPGTDPNSYSSINSTTLSRPELGTSWGSR